MNIAFYIAKRYVLSKSKTTAINIIMLIAGIGIVVSSMALFVVLSIFGGLEKHTLSLINNIDADLFVVPQKGKNIEVNENELSKIQKIKGVLFASCVVEEQVVFLYNTKQVVAVMKAVDEHYSKVVNISDNVVVGKWLPPHTNGAVIGSTLAYNLSSGVFSNQNYSLDALAMKPGEGLITSPDDAYYKVALFPNGIYSFDNTDYDAKYVYVDISVGQELLNLASNQCSKIEIKLAPDADEFRIKKEIQSILKKDKLNIYNRIENNDSVYKMLQTEKIAIYLIFSLVIIVTLFCLSGALIMMILEKKNHFKTLSHIGLNISQLQWIVIFQGMIMTLGGAVLGVVLGYIFSYLQKEYGFIMVSDAMAYPVDISALNFVVVIVTLFVLGFFAAWFAATRMKKILE